MELIKNSLLSLGAFLCVSIVGGVAFADDPSPRTSTPDTTSIQGSAFQDSFTSGYSFARIYGSGRDQQVQITIGDGIMDDCAIVRDGIGAQIKVQEPAQIGTYTRSHASYFEPGFPARTFSTTQVTITNITNTMVYGNVHLVSINGLLDGPFAAQICR